MANKQLIIDSDLPLQQKVMGLILCLAQEKQTEIARLLKPLDISFLQLNLLHALDFSRNDELTVKQLKAALVEDSPNVSRALNKLVDKGLVSKRRCEQDQRTVFIKITKAGKVMHTQGDTQLQYVSLTTKEVDITQLYQMLKQL